MSPKAKEFNLEKKDCDLTMNDNALPQPWKKEYKFKIIFYMAYIHICAIYGLFLLPSAKWTTLLFIYLFFITSVVGVTAGAHRLWAHRSFKAKLPLQIFLMLCHSSVMQYHIIWWSSLHRVHHKYSDTDGDPHNTGRGLFFSHIGWLLVEPHPEHTKKRSLIDVTDLKSNSVLVFQKKYMGYMNTLIAFLIPVLVPVYFWNESISIAWHINIVRLFLSYHTTFMINSLAHRWGYRPFDKSIKPSQHFLLSLITMGEGWHNFHHVFPWDYGSDELGLKLSFTTKFINFFAKIGWAYDLKSVTKEMIVNKANKTGDGSIIYY